MKQESDTQKQTTGSRERSTVLLLDDHERRIEELSQLCESLDTELLLVEDGTDILAFGSFLNIINPNLLSDGEKTMLKSYLDDIEDSSKKFLLIDKSSPDFIPARNRVKLPEIVTEEFLKFLILKTRSTYKRRRQIWEKTERRIVRLIYMMRILDSGNSFKTSEIAKEFSVSIRTIQRDLEILEMSGAPIMNDKRGKHWLPGDFRIYEFYYDPMENE